MKTEIEIKESINGCREKIQESHNNQEKFQSVMTPELIINYEKTRIYIQGWIDGLLNIDKTEKAVDAYKSGWANAKEWANN